MRAHAEQLKQVTGNAEASSAATAIFGDLRAPVGELLARIFFGVGIAATSAADAGRVSYLARQLHLTEETAVAELLLQLQLLGDS